MDGLSEDYRDDTQGDVEKRIEDDLSDASSSFTFARGVDPPPLAKVAQGAGRAELDEDEEGLGNLDWDELERVAREKRYGKAPSSSPGESDLPLKKLSATNTTSRASSTTRPPRSRRRSSRAAQGANQSANLETDVHLTLHQTSIFDSSIFVAFSRLLNPFILSPPSMRSALGRLMDGLVETCEMERAFLMHLPTRTWLLTDGGPFEKGAFEVVCDYLGFLTGIAGLFENVNRSKGEELASAETSEGASAPIPARAHASSTLRLSPDLLLCFWQLDNALGLIAILRSPSTPPSSALTSSTSGNGAGLGSIGAGAPSSANGFGERNFSNAAGAARPGETAPGAGGGAAAASASLTGLLNWNVDIFRRAVVHGLGRLRRGSEKEEVLAAFAVE